MYQINTRYTLNFHDVLCQLYLNFKMTTRISPMYQALARGLRMNKNGPCSQELTDQWRRRGKKLRL